MTRKRKRRAPRTSAAPVETDGAEDVTIADEDRDGAPRPAGFRSALGAPGASPMPGIGRSFGRGLLTVMGQPVLVVAVIAIVVAWWTTVVALGYEGTPRVLTTVLAIPPISIASDLSVGSAVYGIGGSFLAFLSGAVILRTLVFALLVGAVLEVLETGRLSRGALFRAAAALPTTLAFVVASLSSLIAGNIFSQILGAGLGALAFFAAFLVPLFFVTFAPIAAPREGRPVLEEFRRSGRAAMLPNGRHLLFCAVYFLLMLPLLLPIPIVPSTSQLTSTPAVATWVFAFLANVVHVAALAAFAYRWIEVEPVLPEEPVRRRRVTKQPAKGFSAKARRAR